MGHIKEENLVLPLERTQQPAGPQHFPIGGQTDMVGLIPGCARAGQGNAGNHAAVTSRILVEIDNSEEVRVRSGLIPRPNE